MKLCTSIILVLIAIGFGLVYKTFQSLNAPLPLPDLDTDAFWGSGLKTDHKSSERIFPFSIEYAKDPGNPIQELISTLNKPLFLHPALEGVGSEYGMNSIGLYSIVREWRDDYLSRWEEREKFLNQFPQYKTEIQG